MMLKSCQFDVIKILRCFLVYSILTDFVIINVHNSHYYVLNENYACKPHYITNISIYISIENNK